MLTSEQCGPLVGSCTSVALAAAFWLALGLWLAWCLWRAWRER